MITMQDKDLILKDLVVQYPVLLDVFEQYHIDYCCGGHNTLTEAARQIHMDFEELINVVNKTIQAGVTEKTPVTQTVEKLAHTSVSELIGHIEQYHHTYIREQLPNIHKLMAKVLEVHQLKYGNLLPELSKCVCELFDELVPHLEKEENILFPYIRELDHSLQSGLPKPVYHCGSVLNPIGQMEFEHDHAGILLKRIYSLTQNFALPSDACATYQELYKKLQAFLEDLKMHIHLENNLLFPKAVEIDSSF